MLYKNSGPWLVASGEKEEAGIRCQVSGANLGIRGRRARCQVSGAKLGMKESGSGAGWRGPCSRGSAISPRDLWKVTAELSQVLKRHGAGDYTRDNAVPEERESLREIADAKNRPSAPARPARRNALDAASAQFTARGECGRKRFPQTQKGLPPGRPFCILRANAETYFPL